MAHEEIARRTGRASARLAGLARRSGETPSDRRAETQRLLLEAGHRLIAEHGVAATSVGMICQEAGFTRGAFYSNFADMEDLTAQVGAELWESTLASVRGTVDARAAQALDDADGVAGDPVARIAAFARVLHAAVPQDRDHYLLWTSLSAHMVHAPATTQRLLDAFAAYRAGMVEIVSALLDRARLTSTLAPADIVDLVHALAMRSTMLTLLEEDDGAGDLFTRLLPVLTPAAVAVRRDG